MVTHAEIESYFIVEIITKRPQNIEERVLFCLKFSRSHLGSGMYDLVCRWPSFCSLNPFVTHLLNLAVKLEVELWPSYK